MFSQHGVCHSKLLKEQEGNNLGMGGGLRFSKSKICIIEVWSDQKVLESRCDKRVDKMMSRGLVKELEQFHDEYNRLRVVQGNSSSTDSNVSQSVTTSYNSFCAIVKWFNSVIH